MLPVLPGVATFGVISGVAMVGSGMTPLAAMAMSAATYAGTAQLAALQLLAAGAPMVVILFAALVLNLRFALYSLSMAPHFRDATTPRKWLYSYLLSDNGYAHFITRYSTHPEEPGKVGYYLGACTVIWTVWQASTALGVAVGAGIPTEWRLEFTVTLTFFALGISVIRDKAMAVAAATAAITAVLAMGLPYRLGLLVAVAAGIAAGVAAERWTP
ncbi:MAG TPA: AzlC family ABC transporter permease [Burkholderiales bacterium]|nr:AzlC family ABC transporter permease [Burkholderiales bacterium]